MITFHVRDCGISTNWTRLEIYWRGNENALVLNWRLKMENDNSYPRLRVLLQKQIATSSRRSARDLVQSRPLQRTGRERESVSAEFEAFRCYKDYYGTEYPCDIASLKSSPAAAWWWSASLASLDLCLPLISPWDIRRLINTMNLLWKEAPLSMPALFEGPHRGFRL